MTRVIFAAEARVEALEAFRWYEEQRPGLGLEFRAALKDAVQRIRSTPLAYRTVHRDLRRVLLDRFPYSVFYRVMPDSIVVVGVVHGKRHPRTWRRRA
ncbi:MAG: type II toxin-antitoxin system RelE/ParE family toxin [Minicystis sp.]